MKNLPESYKYKSFISYSRAADTQLAPALKAALQGFAKVWYKLRAIQIFCDQTNLAANPDLWASIEKNLAASEYFIYLASPQAAQSKWVRKEINFFHGITGVNKMIIVLTDGEIVWDDAAQDFNWQLTTAVPKLDEVLFTQEPVWIDMRWIRKDQLSPRDPRFLDAIANLSSVLRNVDKDTLIGKDVEEHRKAKRFRLLSITGLSLLAVFLIIATLLALKSQKLSQERLVKTFNNNGVERLKSGDYAYALPWFIEAMSNEKNRDRKAIENYRIENLFNQLPKLSQVWQAQMPVLKTAFLSNKNVMIVTGHSANWWTNEFDCNDDCSAELKVLNIESGNEVYKPIEIKDGIRQLMLSDDKTLFASLSMQNVLRLWNVTNGKLLWQQQLHIPVTKNVFHCGFDFSADNNKLIFFYENAICVYETMNGALVNHFSGVAALIQQAGFLQDGNTIIFLSDKFYRWHLGAAKASVIPLPFLETVSTFVLSSDNKHIVIAGAKANKHFDGTGPSEFQMMAYADLDNMQQPLFIKTVDNTLSNYKIEFDAGNHVLAINTSFTTEGGSGDDGTRVWDALNGNPLTGWIKLKEEVALNIDSAGSKMVITCRDGITEIWSIAAPNGISASKRLWVLHDGSQEVKSVFSPDNKYLLTCGADNLVKLWKIPADDFVPLNLYNDLKGYENYYTDNSDTTFTAEFNNYNDEQAHKVDSSEVYIYDIKTKQRTGGPLKHNSAIYIANISDGAGYVATAALKEACMWNRETQQKLYNFSFGKPAAPTHMLFSNDSKTILIVFTDYTCGIWDVKTGKPVTGYIKHPSAASYVDEASANFSYDNKKIITSDNDTYWIWDAASGDPLSAPVKVYLPTTDETLDSVTNEKRSKASKANTLLIKQLSLNDIRNYSALLAGGALDAGSNFTPLSATDFIKRWEAWKTALKQ